MLTAANVTKQFRTVTAVDNVSLDIREGEIFALLGPNGAGKSTLMRMLLGLMEPETGSITYDYAGEKMRLLPSERIGYLPEDRGLYPDVPVLRTLVHFGMLRGMTRSDASRVASEWLGVMGLGDRGGNPLKELSKGNQQKVQFISAIMHAPAFAVLDEPFSGLDPVNQETFLGLIRQLRASGTTVLLSAHQMSLVESVADRIAVMKQGRVMLNGTLPEIRREWTTGNKLLVHVADDASAQELTLRSPLATSRLIDRHTIEVIVEADASLSPVLSELSERFEVLTIESRAITLHDVYVQLMGAE